MAKRSRKKKAHDHSAAPLSATAFQTPLLVIGAALLLAVVTFLVYWPSLKSDFVYDARIEILHEGFITSLANLPAVLSLKVLGMNLMIGSRPGQLLYLMLIAAISGRQPFGYHLCSNLLHAANVALLFVLLYRLIATELTGLGKSGIMKAQLAMAAVTLIFALHPVVVESVAEVSFSSSLLVTFFTLLALLAATAFRPDNFRSAMMMGTLGTLCAFAAVTSKESGVAAAALLIIYWFLFRRRETKLPWLLFLAAAMTVTVAFLAARFLWAPPASPGMAPLVYLGGSFFQVFTIQPRLWVFMMGKLVWPSQLSVDYTEENVAGLSMFLTLAILIVVVLLQAWLAWKSRTGALGVAIYWLGLATVSNFIPLYRPLADRFYYLPLAGVAMQLLALLLMLVKSNRGFWMTVVPLLVAILPLTFLTLTREDVFADEVSLWKDTLQVSPQSAIAHTNLATVLLQKGQLDEAITQFQKALEIRPNYQEAHHNFGLALFQKGRLNEAIIEYKKALEINPTDAESQYNMGIALSQKGEKDEAIAHFQKALEIDPHMAQAYNNLGVIFFEKGDVDQSMIQYQKALKINPAIPQSHNNLGNILLQKGQLEDALAQFQEAVRLKPDYANALNSQAKVKELLRQKTAP